MPLLSLAIWLPILSGVLLLAFGGREERAGARERGVIWPSQRVLSALRSWAGGLTAEDPGRRQHLDELWDEARWNEVTAAALSFKDGGLPPELEGFSL